jgi:hypothetical protein
MKRSVLAIVALAALTVTAEAESCSQRMARCKSINKVENPGPAGQERCEGYFQACMSTGTWTSRQGTFTGLTKK